MLGTLLLLLIAGFGAGIVTGLYGGSAVLLFVSLLVIFAGYSPYVAIGTGLAVEVLTSITAFYTYKKNKNVDLAPAIPLVVASLIGVFIGSFISVNISPSSLSLFAGIGVCFSSIRFFRHEKFQGNKKIKYGVAVSIFWGLFIGLILGVIGAGGGIAMLIALTMFLGYRIHKAVGTSILIMIFIAFFGAVAHYIYMPFSFFDVVIGSAGGIYGALVSSRIANKMDEESLNKVAGIAILIIGVILIFRSIGIL